jgi:hypothetical protein
VAQLHERRAVDLHDPEMLREVHVVEEALRAETGVVDEQVAPPPAPAGPASSPASTRYSRCSAPSAAATCASSPSSPPPSPSTQSSPTSDRRFRDLPAKVQEAISRTSHDTLRKIYDEVECDEVAAAMRRQGLLGGDGSPPLAPGNWHQGSDFGINENPGTA